MKKYFKDPISSLTHFAGMIAAIPILIVLVVKSAYEGKPVSVVTLAIFGASLILLYGASGIYHMVKNKKASKILQKVDHMMIYVLIAGTYTPLCLVALKGTIGIVLLVIIWTLAVIGMALKIFHFDVPRWVSTGLYLFMGWIAIFAIYPLSKRISSLGLWLLFLGGITYSIGGIVYATKWPKFKNLWFGFHELFHLFILGGSAFHIILMFKEIV